MKIAALFVLFAFASADVEYYTLPDLDITSVVSSPLRLREFVGCYLDETPCTELTATYKKIIPEAVQQACRRCSPLHKNMAAVFLQAVKITLPTEYTKLRQKYDPEDKYFNSLEREVFKYLSNINILQNVKPLSQINLIP